MRPLHSPTPPPLGETAGATAAITAPSAGTTAPWHLRRHMAAIPTPRPGPPRHNRRRAGRESQRKRRNPPHQPAPGRESQRFRRDPPHQPAQPGRESQRMRRDPPHQHANTWPRVPALSPGPTAPAHTYLAANPSAFAETHRTRPRASLAANPSASAETHRASLDVPGRETP